MGAAGAGDGRPPWSEPGRKTGWSLGERSRTMSSKKSPPCGQPTTTSSSPASAEKTDCEKDAERPGLAESNFETERMLCSLDSTTRTSLMSTGVRLPLRARAKPGRSPFCVAKSGWEFIFTVTEQGRRLVRNGRSMEVTMWALAPVSAAKQAVGLPPTVVMLAKAGSRAVGDGGGLDMTACA